MLIKADKKANKATQKRIKQHKNKKSIKATVSVISTWNGRFFIGWDFKSWDFKISGQYLEIFLKSVLPDRHNRMIWVVKQ